MEQENSKKWLHWAGALALIVFAYAAFTYASSYSKMIQPGSYRSFAVNGEGRATGKNDIAKFTYSVMLQGNKDIAEIKKQSDERTGKIQQFLKNEGVKDEDIGTISYRLEPRYQYYSCPPVAVGGQATPCRPSEIVGYTLSQTDSVKIRDLSKVDKIISGVVSAGANDVSQVEFTVDNPEVLRTEAKAAAIKQAIEQAKTLAKTAGFRVGKIISIDEVGGPSPYYGIGGGPESLMKSAAPVSDSSLNVGSNDYTSNVVVRFEIN